MSGAERQARYKAREQAKMRARGPLPPADPAFKDLPLVDFGSLLTLEEILAGIDDPRLAAEVRAQAEADEAEIEEADAQ